MVWHRLPVFSSLLLSSLCKCFAWTFSVKSIPTWLNKWHVSYTNCLFGMFLSCFLLIKMWIHQAYNVYIAGYPKAKSTCCADKKRLYRQLISVRWKIPIHQCLYSDGPTHLSAMLSVYNKTYWWPFCGTFKDISKYTQTRAHARTPIRNWKNKIHAQPKSQQTAVIHCVHRSVQCTIRTVTTNNRVACFLICTKYSISFSLHIFRYGVVILTTRKCIRLKMFFTLSTFYEWNTST